MEITRICIIGAGNISNTRHIPSVLRLKDIEITGIISDDERKIERTKEKYQFINNALLLNKNQDIMNQLRACTWFMESVDAVIIGTPPQSHYLLTKSVLNLGKHVLVEKPMMMNESECKEVIDIANKNNLVLNVMHTFQFSDGIMEMEKRYKNGEFGALNSILEIQLTNRNRRLPLWYNDLPLGLFYDEAAHFFYSARRFGGRLKVKNAHACFNQNDNTPRFLQVQMQSGNIPVQMFMNFNSPICEWHFTLICEKKIAIYDYFKDILVVLKNDNQHLAMDVLRNSLHFTTQYWFRFMKNGVKMLTNRLLYGHDISINHFITEIITGERCFELSGELGLEVISAMSDVIEKVKEDIDNSILSRDGEK